MIADDLKPLAQPISKLKLMPGNPRKGDVDAVAKSYDRFGQRKPVVALQDGTVIAGNHQLAAAKKLGWTELAVVFVDDDEMTAKAFALADNRTADLGSYDDAMLLELLKEVSIDPDLFLATGYDSAELDNIINSLQTDGQLAKDIIDNASAAGDNSIYHNIDVFYNSGPEMAKLGTTMGFAAGIISSSVTPKYLETARVLSLKVNFVDNEFNEYNHDRHLAAVKSLEPRYATVRDLMTQRQCDASGIKYFTFDEIIDMAYEVRNYAENVIVIPKYDCLDDIPQEFMLGYSIPTAYGSTPIDIKKFRERRVHLLGGKWKRQRNAIGLLAESVVSLDNNHMMNIGRFGFCYLPDGKEVHVSSIMKGVYGNMMPILFSMMAIVADLSRAGVSVNGRKFESKEKDIQSSLGNSFDIDIKSYTLREDEEEKDDN